MRRSSAVLLAWGAMTATLATLPAQSPADDAILAELDAAIGLEPLSGPGEPMDEVAGEIATGLRDLAGYVERGARDAVERALRRFNRATTRRPEWGWPEYAMAHAFLLLHDYGAPVINSTGARLGEGYRTAMERHLLEALRRDPGLGRARRLLVDLLLPLGARTLPAEFAARLEVEVSHSDPLPGALLAWARHKRNTGAPQIALPILARAESAGVDPSIIALEQSRILAELGEREEASLHFWAAVGQLSPDGRELLDRQLAWVLDDARLAEFAEVPDGLVGGWLRRHWGARDAATLAPSGTTLANHLEDWALAHRLFRVEEPWDRRATRGVLTQLGYWGDPCTGMPFNPSPSLRLPRPPALAGDTRHEEPVLTSAGALLLRAGRPMAILQAADSGGGEAAEDLRAILRATGWTTLWLFPSEGGYDVYLFGDDARAAPTAAPFEASLSTAAATPAWRALGRVLRPWLQGDRPKVVDHAAMLRCEAGLRLDRPPVSAAATVEAPLDAIVDPWGAIIGVTAFGLEGAAPPVLMVSYAIPTPRLDPGNAGPGEAMTTTIRVRSVAYRLADGVRLSGDTTLTALVGSELREYGFVTGTLEIPAGAGEWLVAVRLSPMWGAPGSGSTYRSADLHIGEGPGLAVSDLLAEHSSLPLVATPLGRLGLNFLGEWPQGTVALLHYQVLGLAAREPYQVTTEVIPAERWPTAAITRVDSLVSAGTVQSRVTVVRLDGLSPGRHWFAVTVTAGEETVERHRELVVVKR